MWKGWQNRLASKKPEKRMLKESTGALEGMAFCRKGAALATFRNFPSSKFSMQKYSRNDTRDKPGND